MTSVFRLNLLAVLIGFLIDMAAGDPPGIPHPVVWIGRLISFSEKALRARFPKTPEGERRAGAVMAVLVPVLSAAVAGAILFIARRIHPLVYLAAASVMCWQIFAARCLQTEAARVVERLEREGLDAAREQVGMLVGRDTGSLTEEQVLKAAVETVAENTSDGVIAPLFWMMLAGPAGGIFYKAVNTMDSMVGYKNDKYLHYGRWAARLDDAVNFLPARLSALGMIAAASLLGMDGKNALRIWRRDRRNHASPNSAQTESVCAGALGVQLGGNASYFGKLYEKPTIGDPTRSVERSDVSRSCRLMYGASVFWLVIFELIGLFLILGGGV